MISIFCKQPILVQCLYLIWKITLSSKQHIADNMLIMFSTTLFILVDITQEKVVRSNMCSGLREIQSTVGRASFQQVDSRNPANDQRINHRIVASGSEKSKEIQRVDQREIQRMDQRSSTFCQSSRSSPGLKSLAHIILRNKKKTTLRKTGHLVNSRYQFSKYNKP